MADNVEADAGSGGATFATDDIGGVHYPRTKIALGANNSNDGDVSTSNPMPVTGTITAVTAISNALPAGNNNIGDVDVASIAAGDNNIGNVDIVTVPAPLSTTGGGTEATALRVTLASDSTGLVSVDDNGGSLTVDGTITANLAAGTNNIGDVDVLSIAAGDNNIGNVDIVTVPAPLSTTGGGTEATALRVTVATDSTGVLSVDDNGGAITVDNGGTFATQVDGAALTALQLIDDPVFADDAAFTIGTSKVMMAGFTADEASTDSLDEGDAGAGRITLDRKQIVTPYPHTAGGLAIFRSLDLDETEEDVKTSPGQVYAMWATNTATTTRFVKFYNATAANVTVGSTTPVITIGIPGNTADDISGNFGPGGMGITFDTAISMAATTGVADADTGAPAANDVIVNVFYK